MINYKILKGRNGEILHAIMNTIIPQGGPFKSGAGDYDLLQTAELILKSFDKITRLIIPMMLKYIQYSSFFKKGKTFTKLSLDKASQYLESMEKSRFYYRRSIIFFLKFLTVSSFFDIDETALQIGYSHGNCFDKKGL